MTICLHLQGRNMKIEELHSSESLIKFWRTTRHHIHDDSTLLWGPQIQNNFYLLSKNRFLSKKIADRNFVFSIMEHKVSSLLFTVRFSYRFLSFISIIHRPSAVADRKGCRFVFVGYSVRIPSDTPTNETEFVLISLSASMQMRNIISIRLRLYLSKSFLIHH